MTSIKRIGLAATVIGLVAGLVGQARAGLIDYAATRAGQFGSLNLQTAVFTQAGNPGTGFQDLTRIAGGPLYAVDSNSNLLTLNTSNGATTSSVPLGIGFAISERSDGVLFGTNGSNLYTINATTGTATLVGSTGLSGSSFYDIRFDASGRLYYTSDNTSTASLYSLNTTTGAATLIGSIGAAIGVLDYENGSLYGLTVGTATQQLYTINTTSGVGTLIGNVTGTSGPIFGLATMDSAVPEPSSFLLCSIAGAVGLGFMRMRRGRSDVR